MIFFKIPSLTLLILLINFEFPIAVNAAVTGILSETMIDLYTLSSVIELTPSCKKQAKYYNEAFRSGETWSLQSEFFDRNFNLFLLTLKGCNLFLF